MKHVHVCHKIRFRFFICSHSNNNCQFRIQRLFPTKISIVLLADSTNDRQLRHLGIHDNTGVSHVVTACVWANIGDCCHELLTAVKDGGIIFF